MKNKNVFIITLFTLITLGALATFANKQTFNNKKSSNLTKVNNTETKKEKSEPKLTPSELKEMEIKAIKNSIFNNIGNYEDNIAVYYENLQTGTTYSLNDQKYFKGASVRKLGNVMSIADLIQEGKLNKNKLISYNPKTDYEDGTGILQNQKKINPISVEKAIELSITHSDNIAARMLGKIGGYAGPYYEKITKKPADNRTLTANQVGILLKRLYDNPDNNPTYENIINHLKNTIFHDRLDKYLPYDKVAHKIGTNYGYYHDAGIVYGDNVNYILVILTENIGETPVINGEKNKVILKDNSNAACETIANISKDIYSQLNSIYN